MLKRVFDFPGAGAGCLSIHIDASGVAMTGGARRTDAGAATPAWLREQCRELVAELACQGRRVDFVIGASWVRSFQVTPPRNGWRARDCRAAAQMRFEDLYGDGAADWVLEADWRACWPSFTVFAMPRDLIAVLHAVAHDNALRVETITPHFVVQWNRWRGALEQQAWFGVLGDGVLTLAPQHGGRIESVATSLAPVNADGAWLAAQVRRSALRLGVPAPALVQLCAPEPQAWSGPGMRIVCLDQPDALARPVDAASAPEDLDLGQLGAQP